MDSYEAGYESAKVMAAPSASTTDAFDRCLDHYYVLMDRLEVMASPILRSDTPQPDSPVESIPATRLEELVTRFERANRRFGNIVDRLQP
jgi:hypothetical protein